LEIGMLIGNALSVKLVDHLCSLEYINSSFHITYRDE